VTPIQVLRIRNGEIVLFRDYTGTPGGAGRTGDGYGAVAAASVGAAG
jgi:hypothetical protein